MFKSKRAQANKPLIIYGIVVAVFVVIAIVLLCCKGIITERVIYGALSKPFTITTEYNEELKFYTKKNKDYVKKRDKAEPLKYYKYYCEFPDGTVKEYNYDDPFDYKGGQDSIALMFMYKSTENSKGIIPKLKIAGVIFAVIMVIVGIVCWFFSWSNREDLKKEEQKKRLNKQNKQNK